MPGLPWHRLGRLGIYELLILDDELRRLMHEGASESKLMDTAREAGMRTLRDECLDRVQDGSTTLEEVICVTLARQAEGARTGEDADAGSVDAAPPVPPPAQ